MRVVLLGPPGSGKGTQGRFLAAKLGIKILGMGDLLRDEVRKGTSVGQQMKPILEVGGFPPNASVMRVLFEHLEGLKNFILDGFPRDFEQAETLDVFLEKRKLPLTHAVFFRVDPSFLLKRLLGRYTCVNCGAPYAKGVREPHVEGQCDFCSGQNFTHRPDDEESIAQERILRAQERDKIVLEYYGKKGILHEVDGSLGVVEVRGLLMASLFPEGEFVKDM